jgi:Gram-negative bacterial TonB protein C-terminal
MIRWTAVSLCCAALFLVPTPSHSQLAPSGVQGSESAYPNSSEGLQKLLHDTVEAMKSKDLAKAAALMNTLIVPADSTWFHDEFGAAFGPRLAAAYQKTKPEMEVEMVTVIKGNAERGWTQPKIFRYDDAATVDSPTDRFLNCMDKVVPLYKTAFDGNRTAYQMGPRTDEPGRSKIIAGDLPGYYIYAQGGFRFVPQEILFMLPKERPIRVQLDMNVMRSKMTNSFGDRTSPETMKKLAELHTKGKVLIHFVLDTDGKIKEINATEGPSSLREVFLDEAKQWTFQPTTLDGEPVEVEVNLETGFQINGKY